MDEFDFIQTHLSGLAGVGAEGLEDDCAWLPYGEEWLVISTDTSIEGVHFPRNVKGAAATERAIRVAASDIAAKGASQVGMLVGLTAPYDADAAMLRAYALGISEASRALGLPLLGGDTTRHKGPLAINVTVLGRAKSKVLRSGARPGDAVYLSARVGSAALGLKLLQGQPVAADGAAFVEWEEAFLRPAIDFDLGKRICTVATSSIDCSDGVLADAHHIASASGVEIILDAGAIPFEGATSEYARSSVERLQELVTAGDDYAIIFTASEETSIGCRIGEVREGKGVSLRLDGRDITPSRLGYRH